MWLFLLWGLQTFIWFCDRQWIAFWHWKWPFMQPPPVVDRSRGLDSWSNPTESTLYLVDRKIKMEQRRSNNSPICLCTEIKSTFPFSMVGMLHQCSSFFKVRIDHEWQGRCPLGLGWRSRECWNSQWVNSVGYWRLKAGPVPSRH